MQTALDSSYELDYHLETVRDLSLLELEKASHALQNNEEVRKMLSGLWTYLDGKAREEEEEAKRQQRKRRSRKTEEDGDPPGPDSS